MKSRIIGICLVIAVSSFMLMTDGCGEAVQEETTTTTATTTTTTTSSTSTTTTSTTLPDTTPPTILTVSPTNGATGVSRTGATISATFNEAMNAALISTATFKVSSPAGQVTGTVTYDGTSKIATFTPSTYLAYGVTYVATVDASVADLAGNPMGTPQMWSFTNESISFTTSAVDSTGIVGQLSSITTDSSGKAYISYSDGTNGDLKYATNVSGSWVTLTVDSVSNVGQNATSLALDSTGKVHISYYDGTGENLKYAVSQ